MSKSSQSQRWLQRQAKDPFVARAKREGWRSRAVFKLEEIDLKHKLVKPNQVIVDLGAAPGGWSQYAAKKQQGNGLVVALDLLDIEPMAGVTCLKADFTDDEGLAMLEQTIQSYKKNAQSAQVDLVLSDLAPNFAGHISVDIPQSYALTELALDFATQWLRPGGCFLVKLFQGEGFDDYLKAMRATFNKVNIIKPKASRRESREVYGLGLRRR